MKQINWSDHILNFLAVIIGVSLAFYVSNSAEKRKEKEEFDQIIRSLIEEIETDINVYENYQIDRNKQQSKIITEVLGLLNGGKSDSLYEKFKASMNFTNYAPRNVTFKSISSSGKLDLIESFELRKRISIYHEVWVAEAEFRGASQINFHNDHLMPWVMKNTDFADSDLESLNDTEVKNMLIVYKSLIDGKVRQYQKVVSEGKILKEELESLIQ